MAVVYAAVAFVVLQAADLILPALGLPDWSFRVLVVFSLLGFPLSLALAWIFDITPEGVMRTPPSTEETEDASGRKGVRAAARAGFAFVTILLVGGAAYLSYRWAVGVPVSASATGDRRAVAVLPFREIGGETEEGRFLADGIHEEILSQLSRIDDLRVISRTSVLTYRETERPIREIGRELSVGTVMEGTVQRASDQVQVRIRLIDVTTDAPLWSRDYTRPEANVFDIQAEIARDIAEALEADLSPEEEARVAEVPNVDHETYLTYLAARRRMDLRDSRADALQAVALFEQAVEADSTFAEAWAGLARARMWLFWSWPGFHEQAAAAVEALDRALELAPDAFETRLAQGYVLFYGRGDYQEALQQFEAALRDRPSDAEARIGIGLIQRRMGLSDESVRTLVAALRTNPRSYTLAMTLAETFAFRRDFEAAEVHLELAIENGANVVAARIARVEFALSARGDTAEARRLLDEERSHLSVEATARMESRLAHLRRQPDSALARLDAVGPDFAPDLRAEILHAMGRIDEREVQGAAWAARLQPILEETASAPGWIQTGVEAETHAALGLAHAFEGSAVRAVGQATRATALLPVRVDAFAGAAFEVNLAKVYSILGEHQAALDLLEASLQRPSPLTRADLRLDPIWDGLRDHPRFRDWLRGGSDGAEAVAP